MRESIGFRVREATTCQQFLYTTGSVYCVLLKEERKELNVFICFVRCPRLHHATEQQEGQKWRKREANHFSSVNSIGKKFGTADTGYKEVWPGCPALPQPGDHVGIGQHPLSFPMVVEGHGFQALSYNVALLP